MARQAPSSRCVPWIAAAQLSIAASHSLGANVWLTPQTLRHTCHRQGDISVPTPQVVVRGKENDAEVTKMPFVPNTYYRKGK